MSNRLVTCRGKAGSEVRLCELLCLGCNVVTGKTANRRYEKNGRYKKILKLK